MPHSHKIIAEIGTSHAGDIVQAKELIAAAAESGADIAKFQWVIADEIVSPHTGYIPLPLGSTNIYERFKKVERNPEFYAQIKESCENHNIEFLCSVFGFKSLEYLLSLNPHAIKIASPEINYSLLLEKISDTAQGIHIILSDGISTYIDMYRALQTLKKSKTTILRCLTQYPADIEDYQLSRLWHYSRIFSSNVGISDHSKHPFFLPCLALCLGSCYTEKHFTLDHNNSGLDDSFALTPKEFSHMSQSIRSTETILQQQSNQITLQSISDIIKSLLQTQPAYLISLPHNILETPEKVIINTIDSKGSSAIHLPHYYTTRRSVFSNKHIQKNQILEENNTIALRSETNITAGIPAEYHQSILGKTTNTDIREHTPLFWKNIDGQRGTTSPLHLA